MGLMKRALEELSCEMGHGGELCPEVLDEASDNPGRFAEAAKTMRLRLGLPAVATPGDRRPITLPVPPLDPFLLDGEF